MRTGISQLWAILLGSFLFVSLPLSAEPGLSGGGINIQPESPPPAVDLPKPGTVDPGKAPTPPKTDRKESQAQAAAMAAMAASMQQISCFMMMQEAAKNDDKMMMAMAMQQCAQAAQTMMTAAENRKNKDKVEADPGKPASMTLGEFKTPQAGKDQSGVDLNAAQNQSESESSIAPDPEVAALPEVPSFAAASPSPSAAPPEPEQQIVANLEVGDIPNTIERARLGYDETGKSGNNPTPDRQLGPGSSVATAKPGATPDPSGGKMAENITSLGGRRRGVSGEAEENVPAAGGGGESSSEGSSPLDAMLATLLGGNKGEEEAAGPNGQEIADLDGAKEKDKPGPNIFEYASYRYRKVSFEEKKIRTKKNVKTAMAK